jgi:hypothetical protein
VGSLSKVLWRECLAWGEKAQCFDLVGFPHGEDPCGCNRDDEIVFFWRGWS